MGQTQSSTTSTATPTKKAVGNKTTELIIGSAASKLQTAVNGLNTAILEVSKLETRAHEGTLKITDLEDKIGGLQQDLKNKEAQNKIDLQLSYDSDRKAFVDKWMQENGMTAIKLTDLQNLNSELTQIKDKFDSNVKAEVAKAEAIAKAKHEQESKIKDLEHTSKEAENKAKISQLEDKVSFLEEQVNSWKDALNAERTASVERAKASQIQNLHVGSSQGK